MISSAGFKTPSVSSSGRKHFFRVFVAGKTRVPKPARGMIAFLTVCPGLMVSVKEGIPLTS